MLLKKIYASERGQRHNELKVRATGYMQRMAEINNVETFIQCADQILEKVKRSPMRLAEAQEEARKLLRHFEGFLESEGLEY